MGVIYLICKLDSKIKSTFWRLHWKVFPVTFMSLKSVIPSLGILEQLTWMSFLPLMRLSVKQALWIKRDITLYMQVINLIIICRQLTLYCGNPNDSIHSATSWQLHCKNSMSSAECCHGNDNIPSFFKSKTNKSIQVCERCLFLSQTRHFSRSFLFIFTFFKERVSVRDYNN